MAVQTQNTDETMGRVFQKFPFQQAKNCSRSWQESDEELGRLPEQLHSDNDTPVLLLRVS